MVNSLPELDARAKGGILYKTGLAKALFSSPAACLQQLRAPLRRKRVADALPAAVRKAVMDPEQMATSEAITRAVAHLGEDPIVRDLVGLREVATAIEAIGPEEFSK